MSDFAHDRGVKGDAAQNKMERLRPAAPHPPTPQSCRGWAETLKPVTHPGGWGGTHPLRTSSEEVRKRAIVRLYWAYYEGLATIHPSGGPTASSTPSEGPRRSRAPSNNRSPSAACAPPKETHSHEPADASRSAGPRRR